MSDTADDTLPMSCTLTPAKHAAEPPELGKLCQALLQSCLGFICAGHEHGVSCAGHCLQHVAPSLPADVHFPDKHSAGMASCCMFCMLHIRDHARI